MAWTLDGAQQFAPESAAKTGANQISPSGVRKSSKISG
jgi:hypothetical protein